MFWNKFFWPSFIFLLIVAILHWIASFEGFYWTVDWYDIMMHGSGGLWVVLFTLWVVSTQYGVKLRKYSSFRNMLIWVFVVGVLWEVHEVVLGFTDFSVPGAWPDTFQDIILDMIGGTLGAVVNRKSIRTLRGE
jgi:uncharacterized membrane protein